MHTEVITRRDDLMIRRLVLEPGEAMPWHTDACHRFSVIVRGQQLSIEFRETGERLTVPVHRVWSIGMYRIRVCIAP